MILVTGGCKSGKSSFALDTAKSFGGKRNLFIATCIPADNEMKKRVERHQQERGPEWETIEAPVDVAGVISSGAGEYGVVLVDCLTLWIANMLEKGAGDRDILDEARRLAGISYTAGPPVILVTNEVGSGIVPANQLARRFRDLAGLVGQIMAKRADAVVWLVAGIPVWVKGTPVS